MKEESKSIVEHLKLAGLMNVEMFSKPLYNELNVVLWHAMYGKMRSSMIDEADELFEALDEILGAETQ